MKYLKKMNITNSNMYNLIKITANMTNESSSILTEKLGRIIAFSFVCLLTVVGNIFIIISVKVEPRLKSVSNYFIINLALADAAVGLAVIPFLSIWEIYDYWPYNDALCDLWIAFDYLFCSSSFLSMCAISMDRYWSMLVETKLDINKNKRSRKRAIILIASTWLLPAFIWVPSVFLNRKIYGSNINYDCTYKANPIFIMFCCIFLYYLPMVSTLIFYTKIYTSLHNQMNKLSIWLTEMDLEFIRSLSSQNISETLTNISVLSNINLNYLRQYSQMSAADAVSAAVVAAASAAQQHHKNVRHKRRSRKRRVSRCSYHHKSKFSSTSATSEKPILGFIFGRNNSKKNQIQQHPHQRGSRRSSTSIRNSSSKYSTSIFNTTSSSFEILNGLRMLTSFRRHSKNKSSQENTIRVIKEGTIGQTFDISICDKKLQKKLIQNNNINLNKTGKSESLLCKKENNIQQSCMRLLDSNNRLRRYASTKHHQINSNRRLINGHNWQGSSSLRKGLHTNLSSINVTAGLSSTNGANQLTRQLSVTNGQNQQKLRLLKQQRVAKMIGVLIVVFLVCWLPITIVTPIQIICDYCISKRYYNYNIWCKYINSTINPLLYMLSNKDFRYGLRRIINRCLIKKRRR